MALAPMVIDGIPESDGTVGPPGPQGPQGVQGNPGATGPAGNTGATGSLGPQGIPGPQGIDGPRGPIGPQGPQGIQGNVGPAGAGVAIKGTVANAAALPPVGSPGDAWITANDGHMWVWDSGTSSWLDVGKVQGPTGPQGPQGVQGIPGPAGAKGDTGNTGAQGIQGNTGNAGAQGPKGDKGDTGAQGIQGPIGATGPSGASVAHAINHASGGSDEILNINAARLTGGTLADARLTSNVPLKNVANVFVQDQYLIKPNAAITLWDTSGGVNAKIWKALVANGDWFLQTGNDNETFQANPVRFTRTGDLVLTGSTQTLSMFVEAPNLPRITFSENNQPANLRKFRIMGGSQTFQISAVTDDESAGGAALIMDRSGVTTITGQPHTYGFRTTPYTLAPSVFDQLPFNSITQNQGGCWVGGFPSRFTALVGGVYAITGEVAYDSNAIGARMLRIRKNGATIVSTIYVPPVSGDITIVQVSTTQKMAINDYIELIVFHSGSAILTITGSLVWTKIA